MYDEYPSELDRAQDRDGKTIDAHYSVGLLAGSDGMIRDTVEGMIAAKAGIGPGMKIVAVNGRRFSRGCLARRHSSREDQSVAD